MSDDRLASCGICLKERIRLCSECGGECRPHRFVRDAWVPHWHSPMAYAAHPCELQCGDWQRTTEDSDPFLLRAPVEEE